MKKIVCFSEGHSSALAAIETARKYGTDGMVLLNHDISPQRHYTKFHTSTGGGGGMDTNEFQRRLRKLREEQQKSRRVVSELCGLPPNAIGRYERGESAPTMEVLISLADYFEVSLDYLTGRINYR